MKLLAAMLDPQAKHALDADGRPLGERNAGMTQTVRCPYSGSRHREPMNGAALQQVMQHFPATLAGLQATSTSMGNTVHAAWASSLAGLVGALLQHADGHVIDVELAARSKVCLGLAQVFTAICLADDGLADQPLLSLGTAEEFLRLLDQGGWLHGQHQVCAGSPRHIAAAFDAMARPSSITTPWPYADAAAERGGLVLTETLRSPSWTAPLQGEVPAWARPALTPGAHAGLVLRLFEQHRIPRSVANRALAP